MATATYNIVNRCLNKFKFFNALKFMKQKIVFYFSTLKADAKWQQLIVKRKHILNYCTINHRLHF